MELPTIDDIRERMVVAVALPPPARCSEIRRTAGYTQVEFAEWLQCSQAAISEWERGIAQPTGKRRRNYAELLQMLEEMLAEAAK